MPNQNEEIEKIKNKIRKKFDDTAQVVSKFDGTGKDDSMDYNKLEKQLESVYSGLKVEITEVPKV